MNLDAAEAALFTMAVGIIALTITGLYLLLKEKSVGWALGSFFIAFMSTISMIGLISVE